jgi:lysophospholipase L1-like esterase
MAVGIVANSSNADTITLSKVVTYEEQTVHEGQNIPSSIVGKCRIKRIKIWEDRVKEIVQKIKSGTGNNNMLVGIGTSGVPNYYDPSANDPYTQVPYTPRRLLGYREKGQVIAQENNWLFVDFFKNTLAVESGVDIDRNWSMGDNTHPNPDGRILFGKAVTEQLEGKLK